MAKRYSQLHLLIREYRPSAIVEVGTWNGKRATELAASVLRYRNSLHYKGYDLFEKATTENDLHELNVKPHHSLDQVTSRLKTFQATHAGFSFELFAGDTNDTLTSQSTDFAYIDGGHSVETIRSDFERLRGSKVIVLDDFYAPDEQNMCPDISRYGCNALIESLPHIILPVRDRVQEGGFVKMALIGPPLSAATRMKLAALRLWTRLTEKRL